MGNRLDRTQGRSSKSGNTPLHQYLALWVRAGLLEFWLRALPEDATVVRLLKNEIHSQSADIPAWPDTWDAQNALVQKKTLMQKKSLAQEKSPGQKKDFATGKSEKSEAPRIGRLIADLELSVPQLFAMCLAGNCQTSHLINLVIAELHSQAKPGRLTIHLVESLLESLFGYTEPLADSILLQRSLLILQGDGPMPFRELGISHTLWSSLCERDSLWPECEVLTLQKSATLPRQSLDEIPKLAALLSGDVELRISGVVVRGHPNSGRKNFAAHLAAAMGMKALKIPLDLWRQHPQLRLTCHYGDYLPVIEPLIGPGEVCRLPNLSFEHPLVMIMGTDGAVEAPYMAELEMQVPTEKEREQLCAEVIDNAVLSRQLANQAMLSGESILAIANNAKVLASREAVPLAAHHIAEARRRLGAEKLRVLAQPVFRQVDREALVLPAHVTAGLDNVIARARKRESLWRGLGKTLQVSANTGVRAMFVGESGTGKTLAASYIATALSAPLYRVDLSAVMNKYIGESEKNLSQLLDHAAASDVVLLFDEADSLFGSRSEGGETGERFANMLTNFLLTRIESYPGVAILTTNSSERIDDAFNRRIDVIVEFPVPGFEERLHLWRSHLGDRGPGDHVYQALASHCHFAGGQIRNAVIAAAVFATGNIISEADLYRGLRLEYQKIGRDMPAKIDRLFAA